MDGRRLEQFLASKTKAAIHHEVDADGVIGQMFDPLESREMSRGASTQRSSQSEESTGLFRIWGCGIALPSRFQSLEVEGIRQRGLRRMNYV
jgi:hypothetical protein